MAKNTPTTIAITTGLELSSSTAMGFAEAKPKNVDEAKKHKAKN
jgi:hypothetical protein